MSAHTETEKITAPLRQALSCWLRNTDISVSNSSCEEICVQTVENLRKKKERKKSRGGVRSAEDGKGKQHQETQQIGMKEPWKC